MHVLQDMSISRCFLYTYGANRGINRGLDPYQASSGGPWAQPGSAAGWLVGRPA